MTKMTAKISAAVLRGELDRVRALAALDKLRGLRLGRAAGDNLEDLGAEHDKALARVESAIEYALNALACFKKSGKSAVKEAKRQGVLVTILTATEAPTPVVTDVGGGCFSDDNPDDSDEAPF